MPLAVGQILNNRYRIDALLGQGGMGAVYRARDLNLNISVALKENLDTSPEARKQFEREAQILARLSHPNLPRVTDHFSIPGQGQYLVMDYVKGQDLQTLLDQHGALPEAQVLPWTLQVCDALTYLHSQQPPIIHRDVKPANIKIGPDGRAMLVDFGIAKICTPYMATTIGAKAFTPGYSPPEQYGAGATDIRSDVYALGATLYHLLTGRKPPESVLRMLGQAPTPPPRQLNPHINPATEQAILRAMEVTTDRRFQRVVELRTALSQATMHASTPTIHKPKPPAPRPTGRRWDMLVLGLVGAVVILLVGCLAAAVLRQAQKSAEQNARATATAFLVRQTQAASTATAQVTATALAQATATAQARLANAEAALRRGSQWRLVLADTFDNNTNAWSVGNSDDEWGVRSGKLSQGKYHWEATARKGFFSRYSPKVNPIGDLYLSVEGQQVSGTVDGEYGLVFRQTGSDYYTFTASGGKYNVAVHVNDKWTNLIKWTQTSALKPGQVNRLAVVAEGEHFTLFINNIYVGEVDDSRLANGAVGIGIGLYDAGDQAVFEFDNFELRAP